MRQILVLTTILICNLCVSAQDITWAKNGNSFFSVANGQLVKTSLPSLAQQVELSISQLTPAGQQTAIDVQSFSLSASESKVLLFTNTRKVWRQNTRGDYWLTDKSTGKLLKLGRSLLPASLMFAKFSPDETKVAYVSENNLYVEDIASGTITQLTFDGNRKLLNGTFDWAYEEEFFCRDGFRWSPDSRQIAYWQIDARQTKDYLMINNTDSIYPFVNPVEYPIAGQPPSPYKIGVVQIADASTSWMSIPTEAQLGSYLPRMEWAANSSELIVQHLNRLQNKSSLLLCNVASGTAKAVYTESDSAWIDILPLWDQDYANGGWDWLNNGKSFVWASEKDGWRHLYLVSRDGKSETLITNGAYDVMEISCIDETGGYVYFMASPGNATQKYLYRTLLSGKGQAQRLSPSNQNGTHSYVVSPNGLYAMQTFSNHYTPYASNWVALPTHKAIAADNVNAAVGKANKALSSVNFFTITTADNITMDAFMAMPANFDSTKKYPVVFYVYTEPWGQLVVDRFGVDRNRLYVGNMANDGYIYVAIDNRGTPVPKGRAWRKSVYRKIGRLNIRDQAMAAAQVLKLPFIDTSRVAVWGWSGGGSATLNLMFQHPEIYKTGIAIAAVANQFTYDNIYQERYMGLPQNNPEDFIAGSPITHAKNLAGNLLYIHGTGDDNVHYNNAEMLLNELIKNNKHFQFMPYPNRSHSISEGQGTFRHLSTLYTNFLKQNCPPGGR